MKYLLLPSLLLLSTTAFAKTYDLSKRFGVGGGAGSSIPFTGNRFDHAANPGFIYNYHARYQVTDAVGWEFNFARHQFQNVTTNAKVYDIMYLIRTRPVDRFTPIFGIGGGVADLSNYDASGSLKGAARARAGFEMALTEDLLANAVVDYQYINRMPGTNTGMRGGEIHAFAPQVNLTLFFGHDKEKSDSKGKGAAAVPVVAAAAMMDSDGDGVIDAKDKCPGTEPGKEVNGYGCVAEEKAHVPVEMHFMTGSARIMPASYPALEELATFLNEHTDTKAEIQGHTDNSGSKAKNKALSQQRADAVRAYLIEKLHVSPSRLSAYGYGDEQPVSDNSTASGKADNRRVMAVISQ